MGSLGRFVVSWVRCGACLKRRQVFIAWLYCRGNRCENLSCRRQLILLPNYAAYCNSSRMFEKLIIHLGYPMFFRPFGRSQATYLHTYNGHYKYIFFLIYIHMCTYVYIKVRKGLFDPRNFSFNNLLLKKYIWCTNFQPNK